MSTQQIIESWENGVEPYNANGFRECHKGAMVGEKATPQQIALWQSLGIIPKSKKHKQFPTS